MSTTDDENTKALIKALIRELHEATKDARIARREIQDERNRLIKDMQFAREKIGKDFNELATRVVDDYMTGLNNALAKHAGDINKMVEAADDAIRQCAADLAGMKDPGAFTDEVVSLISADITQALDSRFITMVEEFFQGQTDAKQHRRQKPAHPPATIAPLYRPDYQIRLPNGGLGK